MLTLVSLLAPANRILTFKLWMVKWLPGGKWLDRNDVTAYADKWVHFSLFALLGYLAVRAWQLKSQRQRWLLVIFGCALATECLQNWIPGRSPSVADLIADFLGLCLGATISYTTSDPPSSVQ